MKNENKKANVLHNQDEFDKIRHKLYFGDMYEITISAGQLCIVPETPFSSVGDIESIIHDLEIIKGWFIKSKGD